MSKKKEQQVVAAAIISEPEMSDAARVDLRKCAMGLAFKAALQYGAFERRCLPAVKSKESDETGIPEHDWGYNFPSIKEVADEICNYVLDRPHQSTQKEKKESDSCS